MLPQRRQQQQRKQRQLPLRRERWSRCRHMENNHPHGLWNIRENNCALKKRWTESVIKIILRNWYRISVAIKKYDASYIESWKCIETSLFGQRCVWSGQFGTFQDIFTSLDHLDCFPSHFRPFSFIISSFKKTPDRPTNGQTLLEMRGCI